MTTPACACSRTPRASIPGRREDSFRLDGLRDAPSRVRSRHRDPSRAARARVIIVVGFGRRHAYATPVAQLGIGQQRTARHQQPTAACDPFLKRVDMKQGAAQIVDEQYAVGRGQCPQGGNLPGLNGEPLRKSLERVVVIAYSLALRGLSTIT